MQPVGKVRSFWVGLGLNIVTLGIYYYFWYYQMNSELKAIGVAKGEPQLANSNPANSVLAVLFGGLLIVPPFMSVWNFGKRIKHAEQLAGVTDTINATWAFLLLVPLGVLVIPALMHYHYVTKHQNSWIKANGVAAPAAEPMTYPSFA